MTHDNVTDIVELTADERELLEGQLHWVPCPHCKGESASYEGGEFCPVCLNGERVLKTTANILANFLPFYDAAQADLATLRKQLENAREAIIEANNSLYGSQSYFLSLDGGPPNKYHLAEGIENLKSNARLAAREALKGPQ